MRIGIFGGSFDPVHIEHKKLCEGAIESLSLDKLFVVPAYAPPHKKGKRLSSDFDRLAMCKIAFAGMEKVEVSSYEIDQKGTSYTYLTLTHFKELYPDAELFFLVGTDMLRDFPTWKHPEIILEKATLGVCSRGERGEGWIEQERRIYFERVNTKKDFVVIDYVAEPISSTRARVLLSIDECPTTWVSEEVQKYAKARGLYYMPTCVEALSFEKESRKQHSIRVAYFGAENAKKYSLDEREVIFACLVHDCAKNLDKGDEKLRGFVCPEGVPNQVWHQFAGGHVCKHTLHIEDDAIIGAVTYHTSGKADMSPLEKLVFLADMLEEGRTYKEVHLLRALFEENPDRCLEEALKQTIAFLEGKGEEVYPLTKEAYEYIQKENQKEQTV